jgi:hypothetical protein
VLTWCKGFYGRGIFSSPSIV